MSGEGVTKGLLARPSTTTCAMPSARAGVPMCIFDTDAVFDVIRSTPVWQLTLCVGPVRCSSRLLAFSIETFPFEITSTNSVVARDDALTSFENDRLSVRKHELSPGSGEGMT